MKFVIIFLALLQAIISKLRNKLVTEMTHYRAFCGGAEHYPSSNGRHLHCGNNFFHWTEGPHDHIYILRAGQNLPVCDNLQRAIQGICASNLNQQVKEQAADYVKRYHAASGACVNTHLPRNPCN